MIGTEDTAALSPPHPALPALVRVSGLTVSYPNGVQALSRCGLEVRPGEFLVLLGSSGAGKSTMLRCINRLVEPTAGSITVSDLPAPPWSGATLREHRRRTGMVFQQHHLIGRQSVLANVLLGAVGQRGSLASLLPWPRSWRLRALACLEQVDLLDRALVRADQLSGGQQQRVGIARALMQSPRLLLADEPIASLDPLTAREVLALLRQICNAQHLTAIVSLHQVDLARQFADRIIGLSAGRVVFEGTPPELDDAAQARIYAGAQQATHAAKQPIEPDSSDSFHHRQPTPAQTTIPS